MKKTLIFIPIALAAVIATTIMVVKAQEPEEIEVPSSSIFEAMPNAVIHQDSAITQLMEDHWNGTTRSEQEMQGWRVQIYSSNNQLAAKQEAEALKEKLEKEIAQPIYINFMQPFWKVRIGNFKTVEEARAYLKELIEIYPELQAESYPVRDVITVKK